MNVRATEKTKRSIGFYSDPKYGLRDVLASFEHLFGLHAPSQEVLCLFDEFVAKAHYFPSLRETLAMLVLPAIKTCTALIGRYRHSRSTFAPRPARQSRHVPQGRSA